MPQTQHTIVIDAPIERCFSVISDYESYPLFLEDMRRVQIERREKGYVVATFELDLIMRIQYTIRLFETPPNGLRWSLEEGNIMTTNNGGWQLVALPDGRTEATYSLELKLKGLIPKSITTKLAGTTLPKTMQSFKKRIEEMASKELGRA